jgi:DMSO reductase anchor subunit
MRPAVSVVLLITLLGAGQGLFLALVAAQWLGGAPTAFFAGGASLSVALMAGGLVASFFHLGRPERAWRAAAMWRTSWLSREVIVLPAFMATVAAFGAAHATGHASASPALAAAGVLLCVLLFVCTGMVYACLKFLREWHTAWTPVNFALLGTASGFTLAAFLAALAAPDWSHRFASAAIGLGALAYLCRLAAARRNARLRPGSTLATAIGIKHPDIRQVSQGFTGSSFNTQEFFHGRPREVVLAMRWTYLALVFPVPAAVMALADPTPVALACAFVLQFAGLVAERWTFFAEANHPQNLYYQRIA